MLGGKKKFCFWWGDAEIGWGRGKIGGLLRSHRRHQHRRFDHSFSNYTEWGQQQETHLHCQGCHPILPLVFCTNLPPYWVLSLPPSLSVVSLSLLSSNSSSQSCPDCTHSLFFHSFASHLKYLKPSQVICSLQEEFLQQMMAQLECRGCDSSSSSSSSILSSSAHEQVHGCSRKCSRCSHCYHTRNLNGVPGWALSPCTWTSSGSLNLILWSFVGFPFNPVL